MVTHELKPCPPCAIWHCTCQPCPPRLRCRKQQLATLIDKLGFACEATAQFIRAAAVTAVIILSVLPNSLPTSH